MKLKIALILGMALLALTISGMASDKALLDSVALISDYKGDAMVKPSGEQSWKYVSMNMPVYQGDAFKTGNGSYAEITFDDATLMRLDSNAQLAITELSRKGDVARTIFNLTVGRVIAIVDKLRNQDSTFEVHTKMAIAAVKGTELAVDAGSSGLGVFTGAVQWSDRDKKNKVLVAAGNESFFNDGGGRPSDPSRLKRLLIVRQQLNGMREEIRVVRELKAQGKDAVIEWRIKKKIEKEGKTAGESDTEITFGGKNDRNTARLEKYLKSKLRNEMRGARQHAIDDLKYVNSEMKADIHLGKTMTDVHGNRVRLEEYVFRPFKNQVDLLSLTLREGRIDYLRAQNIFNKDLPRIIPASAWQYEWLLKQPDLYRVEERFKISNTVDRVESYVVYGYDLLDNKPPAVTPDVYGPKQVLNYKWVLPKYEQCLKVNGDIKEHQINILAYTPGVGYSTDPKWVKLPDDKTFVSTAEVLTTKESFNSLDLANATILSGYTEVSNKLAPITGDPAYNPFTIKGEAVYPGTDKLAFKETRKYNDKSQLETTIYLIDDYGGLKTVPTDLSSWLSLILDTNVEMQVDYRNSVTGSRLFEKGDIDVVSKLAWYAMINPKQ